jgi:hypothetical protein
MTEEGRPTIFRVAFISRRTPVSPPRPKPVTLEPIMRYALSQPVPFSFVQVKRTEVIRELYRLHRRDFGERPAPATIPAWLELNEAFSLMLLPDLVVCATELFSKPEGESRRTPSLAALLWLAADNRRPPVGDNTRKAVADYFLTPADGPSAGRALMRMVRDTKKPAEARALAEAWLKRLPGHPEAVDALGALVKRAGSTGEFMAWAAERFLQPNPSYQGVPKLLAAMLEGRLHDETLRVAPRPGPGATPSNRIRAWCGTRS